MRFNSWNGSYPSAENRLSSHMTSNAEGTLSPTKIKWPEVLKLVNRMFRLMTSRTATIIIRVVHSYPMFVHSWRFYVFHSLQPLTPETYQPQTPVSLLNFKLNVN